MQWILAIVPFLGIVFWQTGKCFLCLYYFGNSLSMLVVLWTQRLSRENKNQMCNQFGERNDKNDSVGCCCGNVWWRRNGRSESVVASETHLPSPIQQKKHMFFSVESECQSNPRCSLVYGLCIWSFVHPCLWCGSFTFKTIISVCVSCIYTRTQQINTYTKLIASKFTAGFVCATAGLGSYWVVLLHSFGGWCSCLLFSIRMG